MSLYKFEDRIPEIAEDAYIAPSAIIIGKVIIGSGCYIGHGSIIRGDYGTVIIEDGTAVEEGVIIHARPADTTWIGKRVTIGHGAMIHNARIEDSAVIGMRATISDYAEVGEWCIIGEMALVKNSQKIPPGKIAVGIPAEIVGDIKDYHQTGWNFGKDLYIDLARRYPAGMQEISIEDAIVKKKT